MLDILNYVQFIFSKIVYLLSFKPFADFPVSIIELICCGIFIKFVFRIVFGGFNADLSRVDDVVVISGTNGVYDLSDLGYEMAKMMDIFHGYQEILERYFDFEAYGRDIDLEVNGFFEDGCYYYMV